MLGKHRFKIIFCTVFLLGSGFWLYGALDDGALDLEDVRGLGTLMLVMLMLGVVAARSVVSERVVESTRQHAYDDGFVDGCEVSRPRVVPLDSGTRSTVALLGATEQLGEQADLRRGS